MVDKTANKLKSEYCQKSTVIIKNIKRRGRQN